MLSEQTVANKWSILFKDGHITGETIRSAEDMIDQLPPESPLRARLGGELRELRKMATRREMADSGS
jgi:hypothetical protein